MLDWLKLELYLYNSEGKLKDVIAFLEKNDNFTDDCFFLELLPLLNLVKKNKQQLEIMAEMLCKYYFCIDNNKTKIKPEVIQNLLDALNTRLPGNNNSKALSYLLSVWFISIFANYNVLDLEIIEGRAWISTHKMINSVIHILNSFIIHFNHVSKANSIDRLDIKNSRFEDFVLITLHILINCDLVEKKLVKKCVDKERKKYKSENFVSLQNALWKLQNSNDLQIYLKPATIKYVFNKLYLYEKHYLNIRPLVRKNSYNKKSSKINGMAFVNLRTNMKLYVRWNLFEKIKTEVFKHFNYNPDISNEDFNKIFNEKKENIWTESGRKDFSHFFCLNYFLKIGDIKDLLKSGFYFHYYFDFRGRIYADSPVAYTHNRYFRYVYYYGEYTHEDLENFKKTNTINITLFKKILEATQLKNKYPKLDENDVITQHYVITIFFEIGKIFKKTYMEANGGFLSFDQIYDIGIAYFNKNYVVGEALYSRLEYYSLLDMLEEVQNKKYLKYPIFKDATASGLQILSILLGGKTLDVYTKSNLIEPNVTYDTYYYIINEFFNKNNVPEKLKKYFTRPVLKKIIMTYVYNATLLRCWAYFKEAAELPWDFHDPLNKSIWPHFHNFYKFLQNLFDGDCYYQHPVSEITKYFKEVGEEDGQLIYRTAGDFEMLLKYFEFGVDRRIDLLIPGINPTRVTHSSRILSEKSDDIKTKRALRANTTHFFDGFIIRQITLRLHKPMITIHDSVGIDILSINDFERIAIDVMQDLYYLDPFLLNKKNNLNVKINSNAIFL